MKTATEHRDLTPRWSREIVQHLLRKRGWSIALIAKTTNRTIDFVRRVQGAKQNFEARDVEALARACRQPVYRLLFSSLNVSTQSAKDRELYEFSDGVLQQYEDFSRVLRRKTTTKRRNGKKVA